MRAIFGERSASRFIILAIFIALAGVAQAKAQSVIPTVCIKPNNRAGTTNLAAGAAAGSSQISLGTPANQLPNFFRLVINPGGATQETVEMVYGTSFTGSNYVLRDAGTQSLRALLYAHNAGETVEWASDASIVWGYRNTGTSSTVIPKGILTRNYFTPGPTTYQLQPTVFAPGVHTTPLTFDFTSRDGMMMKWNLNGTTAVASKETPECATITYQGRLSDGGNYANGTYDLRFTAYDEAVGGNAQSDVIIAENVSVANGVFTVSLDFGAAFYGKGSNARFLEIAVRPGASGGNDPFTVLAPRQPISSAPFAASAQSARSATEGFSVSGGTLALNDNPLQLRSSADNSNALLYNGSQVEFRGSGGFSWKTGNAGADQRMNLDNSGNLTVEGNLAVNGAINGTVTNAANATNAVNASQLGGVAAENYLTKTSLLGQSVTTVLGTDSLHITAATDYTLVPGLTQTINLSTDSAIYIATDGGILSTGEINTFSVVDIALYIDGAAVAERRILISNFPLPRSVGNWSLSRGQALTAGTHTIEIRARYGLNGSAESNVSSGGDPLLRGQLTIVVIKK